MKEKSNKCFHYTSQSAEHNDNFVTEAKDSPTIPWMISSLISAPSSGMTLVTETMSSSVLPHVNHSSSANSQTPPSAVTKGSSKLGFSIDSIVGAKSIAAAAVQAVAQHQQKSETFRASLKKLIFSDTLQ